jgi:dolichol-phosphate mannosyltransferase
MSEKTAKVLIGTAIWNEGEKFRRLADKMAAFLAEHQAAAAVSCQFLVVDDGSDDGVAAELRERYPFLWEFHQVNRGAGAAVRTIYQVAREQGCTIAVTIAGNGKDDPAEIPRLVRPILEQGYDLVQGSRYLEGGAYAGMPQYRILATRYLHPKLLSWFTGKTMTDSTNGFRALRLKVLEDHRIQLEQDWLDRYELEPYLLYQALSLGYRVLEVPVKKVYPERSAGYTKMKPLSGWWSILRPLFLLRLGLRQ